nr:hypothetical protein CFP56_78118 [Quercus suber]
MDTTNGLDLPMGHPGLGFTYGLDELDSSSIARICDNTDPDFESSFRDDVHDLDSSSSRDGCPPLVLDDMEHHSLPSDLRPVDTTNGSELGLGRQDLDSFKSIGYNESDVGEHWLLRFLKAPPFSTLCQCFQ